MAVDDHLRLRAGHRDLGGSVVDDEAIGDLAGANELALALQRGTVKHVAELPDVARPRVGRQLGESRWRQLARSHLVAKFVEELGREDGQIATTFAQRWDV